jgi:hypothetical protein
MIVLTAIVGNSPAARQDKRSNTLRIARNVKQLQSELWKCPGGAQ